MLSDILCAFKSIQFFKLKNIKGAKRGQYRKEAKHKHAEERKLETRQVLTSFVNKHCKYRQPEHGRLLRSQDESARHHGL